MVETSWILNAINNIDDGAYKLCRVKDKHLEKYIEAIKSDRYNRYQRYKYNEDVDISRVVHNIRNNNGIMEIVDNETQEFVGGVSFCEVRKENKALLGVGYFISDTFCRKGICKRVISEAIRTIKRHIINDKITIVIIVDSENKASIKVAESSGLNNKMDIKSKDTNKKVKVYYDILEG